MKNKNNPILNSPIMGYAHHRIILDDAGIPIDYEFLEVNRTFEKLTGLKSENLIGNTVRQVIPGIEKSEFDWIACYGNIALNSAEKEFEQFSEPLGKWYRVHAYSIEKYTFTTMFVDITASKKQSEELESFFSVNLDLLCIADMEGNFIKTNEAWSRILGYSTDDLNTKKFLEFVHPDDIQATLDAMASLEKYEDVLQFTNRYRGKDGDYRFIEWRSHPKGNLIYAAARDVTERIEQEQQIYETKQQYESLVNNIPGITYRCKNDEHWTMLFMSRNVDTITGYSSAELIDNRVVSYFSIIHPEDTERVFSAVAKGIAEKTEWEVEYRVLHKDGSYCWTYEKGRAVYDSKGDVLFLDGFILDITERKQSEKALQENLAFQSIVSEISSQFVRSTKITFKSDVDNALEILGKYFSVDRSYLFLFSDNHKAMSNTHEWCADGVTAQKQRIQNQATESFSWFLEKTLSSESVHVPDIKALPTEAATEQKEWANQNIQSLITVPVSSEDRLWGFIGFDSVQKKRVWSDGEITNLKILADSIGALLQRQQLQNRFETIISNTPAVIYTYTIDKDGIPHLTYINDNVEKILGYQPNEFLENMELWASCVHPQDMPKLKEKLSGKGVTNEYRFKDKAGNYHWLLDNQKVLNEKEYETEMIGTWWDTTEEKESQLETEKLKEQPDSVNLLHKHCSNNAVFC